MPINPSNMRVVDVARLLNSTSFGFVLAQARLYREFNRVGFRIGSSENPRNINLLKYIAWMFDRKPHRRRRPARAAMRSVATPSATVRRNSRSPDATSARSRRS